MNKTSPQKSKVNILAIIAIILALGCLGFNIYTYFNPKSNTYYYNNGADGNSANFLETSIAAVADQVSPSVVSIVTEIRTTSWYGQAQTSSAAGTGMIVSENGYILTNKHVVDGASNIDVILSDGTTYENVELIGTDPLNDIAYLKIADASNLPAVKLGNSDTISVGEEVIAIGNALGVFQNTVTAGIISGFGRTITASSSDYSSQETLTDLIQTDASINAGNSGGPLVNAAGEVIGINSAVSASGENIGFAIPIGAVKGTLNYLLKTGELKRPYLGVRYINIDKSVAEEYGLSVTSGAYLRPTSSSSAIGGVGSASNSAIISDSPAEKAGLEDGDIILALAGTKIDGLRSLSVLIDEHSVGETVSILVLRNGKELTLNAILEAYE